MIGVEFNFQAIFISLERAARASADPKPAYEDISEYMVQATKERFRVGKGRDGTRWRAKTKGTLARYPASGDGDRPDPSIGPSGRLGKEIVCLRPRMVSSSAPAAKSGRRRG